MCFVSDVLQVSTVNHETRIVAGVHGKSFECAVLDGQMGCFKAARQINVTQTTIERSVAMNETC